MVTRLRSMLMLALMFIALPGFAQWLPLGPSDFNRPDYDFGTTLSFDIDSGSGTYYLTNSHSAAINKFDGNVWQGCAPFQNGTVSDHASAISSNGTPYVVYYPGGGGLIVKKFNGTTWEMVGGPVVTGSFAFYPEIAIDGRDTVYVIYQDGANDKGATTMKFNGTAWVPVGELGLQAMNNDIFDPSIAFDSSDVLHIQFSENGAGVQRFKWNDSTWIPLTSTGATGFAPLVADGNGILHYAYRDGLNGGKLTVRRLNDTAWVPVGIPGFSSAVTSNVDPALAFDKNGVPYVAYSDVAATNKVTVMKFDGSTWVTVGGAGLSYGNAYEILLAFDGVSPCVAYVDAGNDDRVMVKKFDGSNWNFVGDVGFSGGLAALTRLAVDSNDVLYAAFSDYTNAEKLSVMKYTGLEWVHVGTPGFSPAKVSAIDLVIDNTTNTPYVIFREPNTNPATLMKFDGANWVTVGGGLYSAPGNALIGSTVIDRNGVIYVGYQDAGAFSLASVKKFDGNSWVQVGTAGFSAGVPQEINLDVDSLGAVYIAFRDAGMSNKATVMKYDGTAWALVGTRGFSADRADRITLDVIGNTPYVGYADGNGSATVMKFDSTSWVVVGDPSFAHTTPWFTALTHDPSGTPYFGYGTVTSTTVMKFNGTAWVTVGDSEIGAVKPEDVGLVVDSRGNPSVVFSAGGAWAYRYGQTSFSIEGKVFLDSIVNCTADSAERGMPSVLVKAEPGPFYALSDAAGNYRIELVNGGNYTVSIATQDSLWESNCTPMIAVPLVGASDSAGNINFPLTVNSYCPRLSVDISTNRLRRCFDNTYVVTCRNTGTLAASNAYVEIDFGSRLQPQSSTIAWSDSVGNVYTFPLGNLDIHEQKTFFVTAYLVCTTGDGTTQCVTAHIYPDTVCIPPPAGWDKSETVVMGSCDNDSLVCFTIKNRSSAGAGNMGSAAQWRLYANDTLVSIGTYQLDGQDSILKCFPANGKTYRLEADQNPPHPRRSHPKAIVEACGNPFSTGFVNTVPQDDEDHFIETFCMMVTGSFDPNDKRVSPAGITSNQYITADDELEYMIRFQNTGTDTAFKVVITDTIDTDVLDIATLTSGASSHNHTFNIYGQGIAEWTFDNILLPDSNVDEANSHGFVQFKIKQLPGNVDGTRIENRAAIYFDFNDPVITNYAWNEVNEAAMPEALLSVDASVITNAKCKNNADGIAEVEATGGLPPYAYLWSNGDTTAAAINLTAGNYTVTVTDAADGVMIDSVIITEPDLLENTLSATHPLCYGDETGTATATASGGIPPYSVAWDNGQTTFTIDSLPAGLYAAVVIDSNGCVSVDSISVVQPAEIVAAITKQDVSCFGANDGEATVSTIGGTVPYAYLWSTNDTASVIDSLPAMAYAVTVTDANNCSVVESTVLTQPAEISYTVTTEATSCNGEEDGFIQLSGGAGLRYLWDSGETLPVRSDLAGGDYVVTVTDLSNCQKVDTITVDEPGVLTVIIALQEDALCYGESTGTATAAASGGNSHYIYEWSNTESTSTATMLNAGTHSVTVWDAQLCTATASVTIGEPSQLIVTAQVTNPVTCYGGSDGRVGVTPSGGTSPYMVDWSHGSPNPSPQLSAGTYAVTVTDANDCSVITSVTLPDGHIVDAGNIAGADTADINLNESYSAFAGFSYTWTVTHGTIVSGQGTNTIVVDWAITPQGIIEVIATDQGCSDTVSRTIALIDPVGVEEVLLNNIELYPNPTSGVVTIRMGRGVLQYAPTVVVLKLYDSIGKEVLQQIVEAAALQQGVVIDMSKLNEGVFFLNVQTETGMRVMKVVRM